MKRIYYLKDKEGCIIAKYEVDTVTQKGDCYEAVSWDVENKTPYEYNFVAACSFKITGCSHWYFYGEDYNGEDKTKDSYYHICGAYCLEKHIEYLLFMWEVNRRICGRESCEGFTESDYINRAIKVLLFDKEITLHK